MLAAGGIGNARGVAAALAAGAAGVRVGTRFLAAAEAGVDSRYVDALAAAHAEDTVLTDRFSPPGVPIRARAVRSAVEAGEPFFAGECTSLRRVPSSCWCRPRASSSRLSLPREGHGLVTSPAAGRLRRHEP